MSNDFLNELLALHPELQEEYNSKQYKLSLEIINLMMSLGINSKNAAKKIGCSHNDYLRMESGDTSIPVQEYEKAILMLKIAEEDSKYNVQYYFKASVSVAIATREQENIDYYVEAYKGIVHHHNIHVTKKQHKSFLNQAIDYLNTNIQNKKTVLNVPIRAKGAGELNFYSGGSYQY